jgi:hypothetical protein
MGLTNWQWHSAHTTTHHAQINTDKETEKKNIRIRRLRKRNKGDELE